MLKIFDNWSAYDKFYWEFSFEYLVKSKFLRQINKVTENVLKDLGV